MGLILCFTLMRASYNEHVLAQPVLRLRHSTMLAVRVVVQNTNHFIYKLSKYYIMLTVLEIFQKDVGTQSFRDIIDNLLDEQIIECVEEYANQFKIKWIDIEKEKPLYYEKGDWDGERTDFVLIATDKGKVLKARAYVNTIGGDFYVDWYCENDYEVKSTVTHWRELPKHPVI